ncbi:MAG: hypothetical protein V4613_09485 [Bacteroidota bacterium]
MDIKSKLMFVFVLVCFNTYAQDQNLKKTDAKEIVRKINNKILESKYFTANLNYEIFKNHNDTLVFQSLPGFYKRSGTSEHSLLVGIETIQNTNERLVIDTVNETMLLSNPVQKPQLIENSLNAAIEMCKSITLTKYNSQSKLSFNLSTDANTGFNKVEINFENATYTVSSITIYYTNAVIPGFDDISNPKITISYTNIDNSKIDKDEFKIESFLKKQNNLYVPLDRFKNFTFLNQYIQK